MLPDLLVFLALAIFITFEKLLLYYFVYFLSNLEMSKIVTEINFQWSLADEYQNLESLCQMSLTKLQEQFQHEYERKQEELKREFEEREQEHHAEVSGTNCF